MAAGNSLTTAIVNTQIASDAAQMKTQYYQWKRWYDYYAQNYSSTAQLSAAGITNATDQTIFQNLTNDLSKLINLFSGGTIPPQTNFLYDVEAVHAWKYSTISLEAEYAQVASYLLDTYYWWQARYASWNTNAPQATLTAAPLSFSTADATTITNVTACMNTLATLFNSGTALASAINMLGRVEAVLGVQG